MAVPSNGFGSKWQQLRTFSVPSGTYVLPCGSAKKKKAFLFLLSRCIRTHGVRRWVPLEARQPEGSPFIDLIFFSPVIFLVVGAPTYGTFVLHVTNRTDQPSGGEGRHSDGQVSRSVHTYLHSAGAPARRPEWPCDRARGRPDVLHKPAGRCCLTRGRAWHGTYVRMYRRTGSVDHCGHYAHYVIPSVWPCPKESRRKLGRRGQVSSTIGMRLAR